MTSAEAIRPASSTSGGSWQYQSALLLHHCGKSLHMLAGEIRFMSTGASPISTEVFEFLRICFGATVSEGYGMTETACTIAMTRPDDATMGHVGAPLDCCEVKLEDIPDMNYKNTDQPYPRGEVRHMCQCWDAAAVACRAAVACHAAITCGASLACCAAVECSAAVACDILAAASMLTVPQAQHDSMKSHRHCSFGFVWSKSLGCMCSGMQVLCCASPLSARGPCKGMQSAAGLTC